MTTKGIIIKSIILVAATCVVSSCGGRGEMQINTTAARSGSIQETVMATGYIQPVEKVEVGTQVSGVIEKIYVDYNSTVKKGQLLAELDKLTLNERLTQANADLASSQSNLTYAQQTYDRTKQLYEAKAATQVAMEEAVNQLQQAQTSVQNSTANLHQARVNLSYANIYSPIDGVVLDRDVAEGQTVAASFSTPTLFTIAEDLTKMQVEADVDEADIGKVRVGQSATFTVDAYNEDTFNGTVNQIRLQPTVTNNVVTYTVIVEAPNPEEKLYPGMTANINITTESESGIIVPVAATTLRLEPDEAKKLGISLPADQPAGMPRGNARSGSSVWVRSNGQISPRQITTGLDDGVNVIVTSGLNEGEEVIVSVSEVKKNRNKGEAASNPLVPQPPRRR